MRLIDAEPLLKAVKENKELYERERLYLEGLLLNAPTVEPFERIGAICNENCGFYRPQGEWISTKAKRIFSCSRCGNYLDFDHVNYGRGSANFCPNCGAEMRKEGNE